MNGRPEGFAPWTKSGLQVVHAYLSGLSESVGRICEEPIFRVLACEFDEIRIKFLHQKTNVPNTFLDVCDAIGILWEKYGKKL